MILSAIAAQGMNRVIGVNGTLPWDIPEDMQYFKDMTKSHVIIMGRKTYESFGGRHLPKRLHVVLTQQKTFKAPGAHVFHEVREALEFCSAQTPKWGEEVFNIGGAEIYKLLLPYTDRIYLTEIEKSYEGDAFFPEFSKTEFVEKDRRRRPGPPPFSFVIYEKKTLAP